MGNSGTKELSKKEISAFAKTSRLSPDEIKSLYAQFQNIKASESDVDVITLVELQRALGFTRAPSRFIDRVFALFDSNHDGKLTFGEFLLGITLLSNAPPKDRMRFSFDIYNSSGDGFITKAELSELLSLTLQENDVRLPEPHIRAIVDGTFDAADLNKDGRIDFAEYEVMVTENPNIMKPITLNVSEILAATRLATGAAAGGK